MKIYVSFNDTELDSKPHYFATKKEAKAFGEFDTIETDTDRRSIVALLQEQTTRVRDACSRGYRLPPADWVGRALVNGKMIDPPASAHRPTHERVMSEQ